VALISARAFADRIFWERLMQGLTRIRERGFTSRGK